MKSLFIGLFSLAVSTILAQAPGHMEHYEKGYWKGSPGIACIRIDHHYDSTDYLLTRYHFYNSKQENIQTDSYLNDTLSGITRLEYDPEGRLKKITSYYVYSRENTFEPAFETTFKYGLNQIKIDQTYYNLGVGSYKYITLKKIDTSKKIIEEKEIWYNLNNTPTVYFESNSDAELPALRPDQSGQKKKQFTYTKSGITIANLLEDSLVTHRQVILQDSITREYLIDLKQDTIQTHITLSDTSGKKLKEIFSGNTQISDFLQEGDGGTLRLIEYKYDTRERLSRCIFTYEESTWKTYLDIQYFKSWKGVKHPVEFPLKLRVRKN